MAENEMRNFALRDAQDDEIGVFTGKSPRQAALKAANRGYTDIKLRERGTKKVHVFTGERVQVDKPAGAPAWMKDKIWKSFDAALNTAHNPEFCPRT
ncbi:MAG: non-histone chromosomal MC1 family protein [Methanothrix sp.]